MYLILKRVIWFVLVSLSSCTDLAAVYKRNILLLRDVDKITPESPLPWEPLVIPHHLDLSHPVGLAYDPEVNRLFVADADFSGKQIVSISLGYDYQVEEKETIVRSRKSAVLDNLAYDPRSRQLYWTDSDNQGVFKAQVPRKHDINITTEPVPAHDFGDVFEPRGIAIDYCNEHLYWSEKGKGTPSTVERCKLDGSEHQVLLQESNVTYQALTYDIMEEILIWAETRKDKNYCRIVSGLVEHQVLVNLENCLPFSLVADKEYIYWSDWKQRGIMRASLTNPGDIVKLVHAPKVSGVMVSYQGVFGLSLLNGHTKDSILSTCKGKSDALNKSDVNDHELEVKNMTTEPSGLGLVTEEMGENDEHSLNSKTEVGENVEHSSDSTVTSKNFSEKVRKLIPNVENKSGSLDGGSETEAPPYTSSMATQTDKLMVRAEICNADRLLLIITVLAVVCTLLISSTIFLLVKLSCQRNTRECKTPLTSTAESKGAVLARPTRQVKRFGPRKRNGSGNKSGFNGTSPCSGLSGDDGVSINIEDCCQMTMCETPCFTSVKREGKGYKTSGRIKTNHEDKKGLLDDREDI
ncbi:uncharacterized protein [Panulirus ornatus]|uniref:uncharacterized protein isoform X2 n=1 Tax=Panulirus ornatus TaxID=150431 RepID=UPI003A854FA2